jgi:serine/threonine protein kinase/WD40 repeat protein
MPAEPNRVATLFAVAVAKPAEERAAYLDEACGGDAELRRRVEALLQAHDDAGSFLEKPAAASLTTDAPSGQWLEREAIPALAEGPGSRIGPYKLLQQIGEGGMGVVFMAEQENPVRRRVALKIIKPGMDSAQVIARFEAERQALAMMDHPNIARVLDAGTTDSGRPYFVMELVYGVPIVKFCDDSQLTPRQRLELFVPICQAIQHAHQKGIIHRDIKPSNVLVTMHDDKLVPKVIDFGVAKAIEQRLTEKSLFTAFGAVVGTLEYMSPEQAEMNAFGVDTRSDVYSLGVLLYELLTGTTPLERKRLREAAYTEVLRLIKEVEPPRPSVRLSSSGDLPKIAAARKTEPERLSRLLRGEIDWIVMRCLEKDRSRRYESASALARDVERYLRDEAVEACPQSVGYRLRKFTRRYRVMLSTATAFAALLVIASGVSIWLALQAKQAENTANEKRNFADQKQREADDERNRANHEADQAKASAAEARQALNRITVAKGIELAEKGDLFSALSWFVKPLERGGLTKEEELVHRTRIACYLRHTPGRPVLRQMFFTDGPVDHAAWSEDAKRVLTVSDKIGRIWDVRNGESLAALAHPENVKTTQFTPDGARVLTASDTAVWQWDARSGRKLGPPLMDCGAMLQHPLSLLPQTRLQFIGNIGVQQVADAGWNQDWRAVEISRDGRRALFSYRRILRLWDLETRKLIGQWLRGAEWFFSDHVLSPDGQRLLLIRDGRVSVHEATANNHVGHVLEHGSPVKAAAISPDDSRALTIGKDGTIQFWDAKTWKAQNRLSHPEFGYLHRAQFSPDSRYVACWTVAGFGILHLSVWDARSGLRVHSFDDAMRDNPVKFDWKLDSRQFLCTSLHGEVALWDVPERARLATILPHGSPVNVAVYGPDARMLLTAADEGEIRIWDLGRGNEPFALQPPIADSFDSRVQHVNVLEGGASHRSEIEITLANPEDKPKDSDLPSMQRLARFLPLGTRISRAAVSPDQTRVLTSHRRSPSNARISKLQLWDARAKRPLGKPLETQYSFNCAAFDPTSRFVVVGSYHGAVRLVDARTGEPMGGILRPGGSVLYAVFSPDGEQFVTCGDDHTARLWQTRTGRPIGDKLRHEDQVTLAAFAADGRTFATVALDGTVHLWDDRGGLLGILASKNRRVRSLLFHSRGLLLLAYFKDKMRLWDTAARQEMSPEMEGRIDMMMGGEALFAEVSYGEMKNPGFDLPGEDEKAGDLIELSQLYSGRRLDAKGGTVPLSKEERQTLWRVLRAKHPAEFAVSPKAAVEWRIEQLQLAAKMNRPDLVAFHRRWLAAELAESGWQPSGQPDEDIDSDLYLHRLHALALHGRHVAATAAAETLALHWPKDSDKLYNCACVCALAARAVRADAALAERYAARAVALLRQAVKAGYKDEQQLRKDPDLDALRRREDFLQLQRDLSSTR